MNDDKAKNITGMITWQALMKLNEKIETLQTEVGLMKDRVQAIGTLGENVAKLEKVVDGLVDRIEELENPSVFNPTTGTYTPGKRECTFRHDCHCCDCKKPL